MYDDSVRLHSVILAATTPLHDYLSYKWVVPTYLLALLADKPAISTKLSDNIWKECFYTPHYFVGIVYLLLFAHL